MISQIGVKPLKAQRTGRQTQNLTESAGIKKMIGNGSLLRLGADQKPGTLYRMLLANLDSAE